MHIKFAPGRRSVIEFSSPDKDEVQIKPGKLQLQHRLEYFYYLMFQMT